MLKRVEFDSPFTRLSLDEGSLVDDEKNQHGIAFDPTVTFTDQSGQQQSLYGPTFTDHIKEIVKEDMGVDIQFDKQNLLYDKTKDDLDTRNYNLFKSIVEKEALRTPSWKEEVPSKVRDELVNYWTDQLYGLNKSLKQAIPKDDNGNYALSDNALGAVNTIQNEFLRQIAPQYIKSFAVNQVNDFTNSTLGFKHSFVSAAENYVKGGRAIATSPFLGLEDTDAGKFFQGYVDYLKNKQESLPAPTGVFGTPIKNIWESDYDSQIKKMSDVFVATVGSAINSFPQNLPSTALTVFAATPYGRALGLTGKALLGTSLAG